MTNDLGLRAAAGPPPSTDRPTAELLLDAANLAHRARDLVQTARQRGIDATGMHGIVAMNAADDYLRLSVEWIGNAQQRIVP